MTVQVLYFEQIRLRNAMTGNHDQFFFGSCHGQYPRRSGSGVGSGAISPRDNYASVRRENRELKLEVARMRLTDSEKDHVSMKQELVLANPASRLLNSFTKKLNTLFQMRDVKPMNPKAASEAPLYFMRVQLCTCLCSVCKISCFVLISPCFVLAMSKDVSEYDS